VAREVSHDGDDDDDDVLGGPCTAWYFGYVFFLLMRLGLSGLKMNGFQVTLRRPVALYPDRGESCARTGIDPEEGNITHGINATPRARTFVGIAVHWPAAGSVEREAVVRISV